MDFAVPTPPVSFIFSIEAIGSKSRFFFLSPRNNRDECMYLLHVCDGVWNFLKLMRNIFNVMLFGNS